MRGTFDFFDFDMTSFPCLVSRTGDILEGGYPIDCFCLFVREDAKRGFPPTRVMPIPRPFRDNLAVW